MKTSQPHDRGFRAFTLVELLTVVAIVGVLVGITLSAIPLVRESTNRSRCASNLRQIHTATMAFAIDNQGYLPSVEAKTDAQRPAGAKENWWRELLPYFTSYTSGSIAEDYTKIFRCDTHAARLRGAGVGESASRMNYGMNWSLGFCAEMTLNSRSRVRYQTLPEPARTIMVSEGAYNSTTPIATLRYGNIKVGATFDGVFIGGAHRGANNILWADGHVSSWKNVSLLAANPPAGNPDPVTTYWRPGF